MTDPEPAPLPALPSFERAVAAAKIAPGRPVTATLAMSEEDRAALAEAFGIPGVEALTGEALAARRGGLIEVEGEVRAVLKRQCVVSLEDMTEEIDEAFTVSYTEREPERGGPEAEVDLDAPEWLEDGTLDLGAVLIEQLVLAMTPHPRKPGAVAPTDPGAGVVIGAFDALKALKTE